MDGWVPLLKLLLFSIVVIACLVTWEVTSRFTARQTYTETFNSGDLETVLEGQIVPSRKKSPWSISVRNQQMVWRNRSQSRSTHFLDVSWVRFDGSSRVTRLEGADISVTVAAKNSNRGGAGILIGSGMNGRYWTFNVDAEGRYHVFRKEKGRLSPVSKGVHPAIHVREVNRISSDRQGDEVIFLVNDEEVVRVPLQIRRNEVPGVGLSAFGTGNYKFDDLVITQ